MQPAGYWFKPGPGYSPKYLSTVWSMIMLGQLGASAEVDERVARACAYVIEHAMTPGGQFSDTGGPGGTYDCLHGNLLTALLDLGSTDPRLERAIEWAARTVTGEGIALATDRDTPMRYNAQKCGPLFRCNANGMQPCAWGAVKIMLAFAKWPKKRRTPLIQRAIDLGADFLLSTDPAAAAYPTRNGQKPDPRWRKFGFPVFYVADVLQTVEALALLGYGQDPRLANALRLILDKQDHQGRWTLEHDHRTWVSFGAKKTVNKWVTLRALRTLRAAS